MDWSVGHASLVVGAGVGALLLAILYWTFSERKFARAAVVLTIAGATCVIAGPIGQWIGGITNTIDGWVSGLIAQLTGAVVIGGLVGLVLIVPLVLHIKNNKINTKTLVMGAASPIAVAMIPGYVGWALSTGLGWIAWLITWPIALGLNWY